MATTSEVARAVSVAFRIPVETVQMRIRVLREADKILTTGRGRSVSKLDLHHVAVTIIACLSTPIVKDGPIEVDAFGSLLSAATWNTTIRYFGKREKSVKLPPNDTFNSVFFVEFLSSVLADVLLQIDGGGKNKNKQEYYVSTQSITLERAVFIDREKVERRAFASVTVGKTSHMRLFFHQSEPLVLTPFHSDTYGLPWIANSEEPVIYSSQTIYIQSIFNLIKHLHSHAAV